MSRTPAPDPAELSWLGPPLDVRALFPVDRAALLALLAGLAPGDWARATGCPGWSVKDVVAHVLHDHIRRLSGGRDGQPGPQPRGVETLAGFVDRANEDFVHTARQFSPRLLIEFLTLLGPQVDAWWADADLGAAAGVEVSWAAPGVTAPLWLDVAREYTELWVHQQQIRDALSRPGGDGPHLLGPVLDTFLRALPQALRPVAAPPGTVVRVRVPGEAGGTWSAVRGAERWALTAGDPAPPAAEVEIGARPLWRLATRGITPREARAHAVVRGDRALTASVLRLLAVVRDPDAPGRSGPG